MGTLRWIVAASTVLLLAMIEPSDGALAAMSIDLGSQFLKIALVKSGVPMEIVLNEETRRKTPTHVVFHDDERFFGDAALAKAIKYPTASYPFLLDLLAQTAQSPLVKLYRERFGFDETTLKFDEKRGTPVFVRKNGDSTEEVSVETLLGMILAHAKKLTEAHAGQSVKDAVITVPAFATQTERQALRVAAQIAGLNLLQLMSDGAAAALSHGVFRRKEITDKPQRLLIYDMGASKSVATIIEYVQEKQKGEPTAPVLKTLGVGWDRTLGGLELTLRLFDLLAKKAEELNKFEKPLLGNARARAKLFKEAERVKHVLSANAEINAQVEALHEEKDFRVKVTREMIEELMADFHERVGEPVNQALRMADLTLDQIDQVVLFGGGTRVPLVQQLISKAVGEKELGKFLNTDEAAAMGAVYQAAALSKSFRALPFGVKEIVTYPIQVSFTSVNEQGVSRLTHRVLFPYRSHYPAPNKMVSFTTQQSDFDVELGYTALEDNISKKQLNEFGPIRVISTARVKQVAEAHENATKADAEAVVKGIKVAFSLDASGVSDVVRAEFLYELPPLKVEEPAAEEENILEAKNETESASSETEPESTAPPPPPPEGESPAPPDGVPDGENATTATNQSETEDKKEESKKPKPKAEPKPRPVKTSLPIDVSLPEGAARVANTDELKLAVDMLAALDKKDAEKAARAAAQNALESTLYDLQGKLEYSEGVIEFANEQEIATIKDEVAQAAGWFDEHAWEATTDQLTEEKAKLTKAIEAPTKRQREQLERPKLIEALKSTLNHTEVLLAVSSNFTEGEDPALKETDLDVLKKLLTSTTEWWTEQEQALDNAKKTEDAPVSTETFKDKIRGLDREVKYILRKVQSHVPKKKPTKKEATSTNGTTTEDSTEKSDQPIIVEESFTDETTKPESAESEKAADGETEDTKEKQHHDTAEL